MLHQFYQNLWNKIIFGEILKISLFFLFLSSNSFAQGFYGDFFKDINLQKENFQNLQKKFINNRFDLRDIKDINQVKINQEYLTYILSNSPSRYTTFAANDKCSLYDLLNTNLLRSPLGEIKKLLITYENKNNSFETRLVSKKIFLERIVSKQCPKFKEFSQHFNPTNLRRTLKNIRIQIPETEADCIKNIYDFQNDVKSPYLCQIAQTVKAKKKNEIRYRNMTSAQKSRNSKLRFQIELANSYQKIFTKLGLDTVTGFCENLAQPVLFCRDFFRRSMWNKLYKQKPEAEFFKTYCVEKNLKNCTIKLNSEDYLCHYRGKKSALFPKANCNTISQGLLTSRLFQDYNDCPATIKNENMISLSRLLNHVDHKNIDKTNSCNLNTIYPFAKFNKDYLDYDSWQVKICYNDTLIGNEKVCLPTIFGEASESPLSISNVIQKITYRLKGNNSKCKIVEKSKYSPTLLEYKAGCYIINDFKTCSGKDCKFKVLLDGKVFDKFYVDYNLNFDLFPISYLTENKSIKKQIKKFIKREFKQVKNTTVLKRFLKKKKDLVFIGIGCAEDLLPSYFPRYQINQCRQTSFIVDNLIEENGKFAVQLRTSMDHIHSPRVIPWSYVFSAVKEYQKIHPLKSWEFYAFY